MGVLKGPEVSKVTCGQERAFRWFEFCGSGDLAAVIAV